MSALREMRALLQDDLYRMVGSNDSGGEIWEAPGLACRVVLTPYPEDGCVAALVICGEREDETNDADADWLDRMLP